MMLLRELIGLFGKIVSFITFAFESDKPGSSYVLAKPFEWNETAKQDRTIPRVKPFSTNSRGYVVFNVADLDGSVGLLTELKHAPVNGKRRNIVKYIKSKYKYVIRPGRSFPKDIDTYCGNIKDLYANRTPRRGN
jgi:hypothetical protein